MPDTGSSPNKIFTRLVATFTGSDAFVQIQASGRKIQSVDQDEAGNDIATALNDRLSKSGGNQPSANLPMNSFLHTGVGNATARTHYLAAAQAADSSVVYAGASSGTDTITASVTPAITAYVTGQKYHFKAGGTNTGAATINLNSVGALAIKKGSAGSTALAANDIVTGGMYVVLYDGTNMQLLNPGTGHLTVTAAGAALIDDADAAAQRTTLGLGTMATQAASAVAITGGSVAGITDLAVADGGTGASTAAGARTNLGAILTDAVFPGAIVAIIQDQKTSGTNGGIFAIGADRTRTLNTLVYNRNTTVSIASNQFTLPAGSWLIEWSAPAYRVDSHQSLLYNVTDSAEVQRGATARARQFDDQVQTTSAGAAVVTIAGAKAFEIRHRGGFSSPNDAEFGQSASYGTEVYTQVKISAA